MDMDKIDYLPMHLEEDGVVVEWEYIGEGYTGDYDPEDTTDLPLLRFSVWKMRPIEEIDPDPNLTLRFEDRSGWDQVEDASYCTQVPIDTDKEILEKLLKILMYNFKGDVQAGNSVKKIGEEMSWIDEGWIDSYYHLFPEK